MAPGFASSWLMLLLSFSLSVAQQNGNVRLVGGKSTEGRVEVYYNGQWGTVCDDGWDMAEARVVCRQLNFAAAISAVPGGTYGQGSGPIWLDDLDCTGNETALSFCPFKGWAVTDCTHSEDAAVICERGTALNDTRLHPLDHSMSLSEDMGKLFDSKRGCDVNITVKSPSGIPANTMVCAHRVVLHLSGVVTFFNTTKGSSGLTMMVSPECRPQVNKFLRYLYTRQIDITISSAQCIHKMASDFQVRWLQVDSGRLFASLLPEDKTFKMQVSLYEYSVRSGDHMLRETCLQYLAWNCEALIRSEAWLSLVPEAVQFLLSRSDLVVPDEAFLLCGLERWLLAKGKALSQDSMAALLRLIRFPMISPEDLYDLPFTSKLYSKQQALYSTCILQGYQFHALSFEKLKKHMDSKNQTYSPRIYTASPWSFTINASEISAYLISRYDQPNYSYNSGVMRSFNSPVHNSAKYPDKIITWFSNVFLTRQECLNRGLICDSEYAASLYPQSSIEYQDSIRYSNRILLLCDNSYVFHVQEFKNNVAQIPTNQTIGQIYPCDIDQYAYRFVVRPEYIL